MIICPKEICSDFTKASRREWLEANGLGGFACSTISGMNTRRYHGLLTAALRPPVGRYALLSKFEETLIIGEQRVELSTNQYAGAIHPCGFELLTEFRLDPFPVSTFEVCGVRLEKSVFMPHEKNAVVVEYRVLEAPENTTVSLEISPLIAFRDYHSTTHENGALNPTVKQEPGVARVAPYDDQPELRFAHNAKRVETQGYWYRQFFYAIEAERGLDSSEDLFNPLTLHFELGAKGSASIIASIEPFECKEVPNLRRDEIRRREKLAESAPQVGPAARRLALAADQFLVRRGKGFTIVAGYPWFTDWGRDTMIALPGLTLFTGNENIAKGILREFAKSVDMGMLPNRFPDAGEMPEFNTVDATLWFFEAVRAYFERTSDRRFVEKELFGAMKDILEWHKRGTRYNIRMLDSGLLHAGQSGVQLTWMDAKIGDWVVTPRTGLPVEIQALWYNALRITADFAREFGDGEMEKRCGTLASLVRWSFNRVFWNKNTDCLYDVVLEDGSGDGAIRPNQIFAVSLRHSMLNAERQRKVLEVVEKYLLTPYGLRSLSPTDPNYKGRYEGGPFERDSSYHQGTVWPYLIGPFVSAYRRVHEDNEETHKRVRDFLRPLEESMSEAALGQCAEIYDGDSPQVPRGCFAQAWTIGEMLRVLSESADSKRRDSLLSDEQRRPAVKAGQVS